MINTHTTVGKVAALAMLPSLTLGIFAVPALAYEMGPAAGITTVITTANVNSAVVSNSIKVKADTGDNTSNGGSGAAGGNTGSSGSHAGDGGLGGNGGSAAAEEGYAEGGAGGFGAAGGNTGSTGAAGAGGDGAEGGSIDSGNATAGAVISNTVNFNVTEVELPADCDCAQYNEYYEAADSYYETHQSEARTSENRGHRRGASSESEAADASEVGETHWEVYSKEFVPVTTVITTINANEALVANEGEVKADTGDNTTDGGDGAEGGTSGDSGSYAGDGGTGGTGGDATVEDNDPRVFGHRRGDRDDNEGTAIGGAAADGATGGDTGDTGAAGNGGTGGTGGVVVTGHANSALGLENFVNINNLKVTRIVR